MHVKCPAGIGSSPCDRAGTHEVVWLNSPEAGNGGSWAEMFYRQGRPAAPEDRHLEGGRPDHTRHAYTHLLKALTTVLMVRAACHPPFITVVDVGFGLILITTPTLMIPL